MPRGDRTGPMGAGPMTGRGAGYCAGYNAPGYADFAPGFRGYGFGRGRGFGGGGRGWRHVFYATGQPGWARASYTPPIQTQNLDALKAEASWLKGRLEAIQNQIAELEGPPAPSQ